MMENNEKLYLMIKTMQDLRGSWAYDCQKRADKVIELANELNLPIVAKYAKEYIEQSIEYGDWDGRWFRTSWEHGGYEDAPIPKLETFSRELLQSINKLLNFPEYALPDEDALQKGDEQ